MDLDKIARRVAASGSLEVGKSLEGPWQPTTPEALAKMVDGLWSAARGAPPETPIADYVKMYQADDTIGGGESGYAEPSNGVILYFKSGDRIFQVSDVFSIHSTDAFNKFDVQEFDDEWNTGDFLDSGDDISALISEAISD